jgi:hypothetical protein
MAAQFAQVYNSDESFTQKLVDYWKAFDYQHPDAEFRSIAP